MPENCSRPHQSVAIDVVDVVVREHEHTDGDVCRGSDSFQQSACAPLGRAGVDHRDGFGPDHERARVDAPATVGLYVGVESASDFVDGPELAGHGGSHLSSPRTATLTGATRVDDPALYAPEPLDLETHDIALLEPVE